MSLFRTLKHLPEAEWPPEDHVLFEKAYALADIFEDDKGTGAHLSEGTRITIRFGWRRGLGFLAAEHRKDFLLPAADRITPCRVRAYIQQLNAETCATSVAMRVTHLYTAASLIAPDRDWSWLKALKRRLHARAHPKDRFERLVPAHRTLDLSIALMDTADNLPRTDRLEREIQFRDGLIIAILSLWPIRRRSLAALTLERHVKRIGAESIELLLFPADTKSQREESWPVPSLLLPYMKRYLDDVRPRLARLKNHAALWVGRRGNALQAGAIYDLVCRRTADVYGLAMSLHDFRRAAATFLAMEAPEKVGLTTGVLQHASPETGNRYYNLSRSVSASRRHSATLSALKDRLRPGAR